MAEALKVQKELWYREIDNIFKAMELKKGKRIQTVRITKKKKHETEIIQKMFEITKIIYDLKNMLKSEIDCTV